MGAVAPTADLDWGDELAGLVDMFEASEDASWKNRELAERDVDYYHNKQWTEKEVRDLRKRGQPAIMKNRIRRKIKFLQGLEQQQRTDPRAVPRTPKHEDDAYSATAGLRYECDRNRYAQTRSKVFWDVMAAGWGGTEVTVEEQPGSPNPKIVIRRCQWDRMWFDAYSQEDDFSDARHLGLVLWMDREEAVTTYGEEASKVFEETVGPAQVGGTYDDKPKLFTWAALDKKRWRIRVVQAYFKADDGKWYFAEFTKGGLLNYGPSPWKDENGEPEHPYSWGSANVDRDNQRYGEIRSMIDLQDAINKRESKLLHLVSVRQTFGQVGAFGGKMTADQMRVQLAKPDGHIELAQQVEFGKHFGIIPTGDMADAQFQILQADNAEMDLEGPNAAMAGKGQSGASGRSILAQQQGGSIEQSGLLDTLRDIDLRTYRKIWNRIRQFWQAEQWVSVTDDMRNLKWVGLNQPAMQPVVDPMTGQPAIDPQTGQPAQQPVMDPMTGQPQIANPVSELDVDITIDDAPHVGTMQDEEFGRMVELAKIVPALQALPAEDWIGMSNLQRKSEIAQKVGERQKAAEGQPNPEQQALQAQMQMKQMQAQADQAKVAADIQAEQVRGEQELLMMRERGAVDMEIARQKAENDMRIAAMKAQADIELKALVAARTPAPQPFGAQ